MALFGIGAIAELRAATLAPHRVLACVAGYTINGAPYIYGGETGAEGGWDCSGAVQWCHYIAGVRPNPHTEPLYRLNAQGLYNTLAPIPDTKDVLPGDLAFYGKGSKAISHVVMVLETNAFGSPLAVLSASNGTPETKDPTKALAERRALRIFSKATGAHLYRADFVAFRKMPEPA